MIFYFPLPLLLLTTYASSLRSPCEYLGAWTKYCPKEGGRTIAICGENGSVLYKDCHHDLGISPNNVTGVGCFTPGINSVCLKYDLNGPCKSRLAGKYCVNGKVLSCPLNNYDKFDECGDVLTKSGTILQGICISRKEAGKEEVFSSCTAVFPQGLCKGKPIGTYCLGGKAMLACDKTGQQKLNQCSHCGYEQGQAICTKTRR